MAAAVTDQVLFAYLDEALTADQMARIEKMLRDDTDLAQRLANLVGQRDAGVHSIGEIWRRNRVSCLTREVLANYLLGAVMDEERDYIDFHLNKIQCRYCQSNLEDLRLESESDDSSTRTRRQKYFQSSIGHLRPSN